MRKKILMVLIGVIMIIASSTCVFADEGVTANTDNEYQIKNTGNGQIVPYGTTSKRVLTSTSFGTKRILQEY